LYFTLLVTIEAEVRFRAHAGFVDPSVTRKTRISNELLTSALAELANHDFTVDTDDEIEDNGRPEDENMEDSSGFWYLPRL
jgi:hypothetical protein